MQKGKKDVNNIKSNKVRNRIIAMVLIAVLLPLGLLGFLSYDKSHKILSNKLETTMTQTLSQVNTNINTFFKINESIINMISDDRSFSQMNQSMSNTGKTQTLFSGTSAYVNMKRSQMTNGNFNTVYYGNENGGFYTYPAAQLEDFDPRARPWYQEAIEKDKLIWTDPYVDDNTGEMVISVAKPIKDNGKVVGVMGADIMLSDLTNNVLNQTIGSTGYLVTATKSGKVVTHHDTKLIGKDTKTQLSFWETVKSDKEGFEEFTDEEESKFLSFTTNENIGWKIIAIMNEDELLNDTRPILNFTLIIFAIGIILALIFTFIIGYQISNPLKKINAGFRQASMGDLTTRVTINSKDEFGNMGKTYNLMLANISNLIQSVKDSSKIVTDTSHSLSTITDQTSMATNEVASAIDEIAKSSVEQSKDTYSAVQQINNLGDRIEKVTNINIDMNNIAQEAEKLGDKGLETLVLLTEKTNKNNESADEVGKIILDVDESSKEISTITEAISQISDQTNLLALNAAIEAARAGEYGKGFAVVADEIRSLAEQSSQATNKVRSLIEKIQSKSKSAVEAMEQSKLIAGEQNDAVNYTKEVFNEISTVIQKIMDNANNIKGYNSDMKTTKDGIVGVIESLSASSEETSASTQQVSASIEEQLAAIQEVNSYSQELRDLAQRLDEAINQFKI